MIWRIKSIGSFDMLTDYSAFFTDVDNPSLQPSVEQTVVILGEAAPAEGGTVRKEDYLVATVQIKGGNKQTKFDALMKAFDALIATSQKLTALDNDNVEWYVMARIVNHSARALTSKITLQVADSIWRRNSSTNADWTITASGQTKDIEVGGTVDALPTFTLTIHDAKTGGFAQRRWVRLYNPNAQAIVKELVEITNGGLNTAALVTAGKMQADGDDARVYDGGQEVNRFLYGMNGASTKIFAGPFDFAAKIEVTLSGTIANSGTVTVLNVKATDANKAALTRLPNTRGIIEIDNERFIYTGRDASNKAALKIYIEKRAVRTSSMASHSDGASIKWIQHDVWLCYGNSSLGAPVTDERNEAAFDIATSTNSTRVYTSFGDKAGLRPGAWKRNVLATTGKLSHVYSGSGGDETTDPMTVLGMAIKSYIKSGAAAAESARLECRFTHPGGITSVQTTGTKRRTTTTWPTTAALQKSKDGGTTYTNQFNEATPASLNTAVSITNTALQTLGAGYTLIRFYLAGTQPAKLGAEADFEIDSVTVVITNPITAALQTEESNYDLDCEIQNVTTGKSIFMKWTMALNDQLIINTDARTAIHSDGSNAFRGRRLDAPRLEWLGLKAGTTNQLKFVDAGTSNVSLGIAWLERRKR